MPSDGSILKAFVEQSRIRPVRIYESMQISKQAFYALYKSNEFELETIHKLEKAIGAKWEEIKKVNVDDNTVKMLMEDESDYKSLSMRAIINLTESNKSIADSNRSISESNASLARSNEELVRMVKDGATANVPKQIQKDAESMRSVVLELLFEVGSGKRWKSSDEVATIYRKRLADVMGLGAKEDTQKNSDTPHTAR